MKLDARAVVATFCLLAGAVMAAAMVGNHTVMVAPWLALFLTQRYVRLTQGWQSLVAGAAAWALASTVGWSGVLPLPGWTGVVVPAATGALGFVPFVVDRLMQGRVKPSLHWLVLPLAWIVVEALFSIAGAGSWGALGYSQYDAGALLAGNAILGMAWPVVVVAGGVSLLNQLIDRPRPVPSMAVFVAVVAAVTVWGAVRIHGPVAAAVPTVRVAGVVVDNREAFTATWAPLSFGKVLDAEGLRDVTPTAEALFDQLLARTDRAAAQGARLIVWSEGNALVPATEEERLVAKVQTLAAERNVWIFAAMAVMTENVGLAENVIVVVDDEGRIRHRYLKSHPTPGEASIPGEGRIGYADTPYGRVAWAICYDFDYPGMIAQAGRVGADILIDPSWDSPGMTPLHSRMAAFRALETGATLVRVVNDGLNLVVDGAGRRYVEQQVGLGETAVWTVDVPAQRLGTLHPWIVPFIGWAAGAALLALGVAGRRCRGEDE